MPRHVVERGSVNGSEGMPNNNRSGNVPLNTPPTPPGISHPSAGSGGFPQYPASMPPGSGMPAGQPYPNFPHGHAPNEYPIYQPPQKQQPAAPDDTEQEQTPQPDQQEQPQQLTNSETESERPRNSVGTSAAPQTGHDACPGAPEQQGQTEEGRKFRPLFAVLGVVVLVAAIGGVVALMQRDKISEVDQAAVDNGFVDGTLVNCDLGEEFYESVAWNDVYQPHSGDDFCSGWVDTAEGDVLAEFYFGGEDLQGSVAGSRIETWEEISSVDTKDPWCMMISNDASLADVKLYVPTTCEPLHSLALKLSNLSHIVTGDEPSKEDDGAANTPVSIASPKYSMLLSDAHPLGTVKNVESEDLKGATLEPTSVEVTPFGSAASPSETSEICVDAMFNVGAFKDNGSDKFKQPALGLVTPSGRLTWLKYTGPNGKHSEFDDIPSTYCGTYTGEFRDTTMLLVSYGWATKELTPVWKFDLGGEEGTS